jgi:DNA-binding Lrp family transcriptional regulator
MMNLEYQIIKILKKEPRGLTITEIAEKLKTSRITVRIRLEILKERRIVDFKQVGPAKLYFIK